MLSFTPTALCPGGNKPVELEAYWFQKWSRHFGKERKLLPAAKNRITISWTSAYTLVVLLPKFFQL